jgi:hypothetical protein
MVRRHVIWGTREQLLVDVEGLVAAGYSQCMHRRALGPNKYYFDAVDARTPLINRGRLHRYVLIWETAD